MVEKGTYQPELTHDFAEYSEGSVRFPKGTWIYPRSYSKGGTLEDDVIAKKTDRIEKDLHIYESLGSFTIHIGFNKYRSYSTHTEFLAYAKKARSPRTK